MALALGCTVRELSERMTHMELLEWSAYYSAEPWGSDLDGKRMALNTAQVLNAGLMMADPKKLRTKPFKHEDFYIGVTKPPVREQRWQDQYKMLLALSKPKKDTKNDRS